MAVWLGWRVIYGDTKTHICFQYTPHGVKTLQTGIRLNYRWKFSPFHKLNSPISNALTHYYVTTLLTQYVTPTCSNPQRDIFWENIRYIQAARSTKWVTGCNIQLIACNVLCTAAGVQYSSARYTLSRILHLVTHFVDLAVWMYQMCSPMMTL